MCRLKILPGVPRPAENEFCRQSEVSEWLDPHQRRPSRPFSVNYLDRVYNCW